MADVDTCVVCGAPVPEGYALCWSCRESLRHSCAGCHWRNDLTGVCCNPKSKHCTDNTTAECYCDQWEGRV
ncbi:MAG: hypothetical protein LUC30_01160 [Clostridiales bacterium]|nr:hypothetical protein [Clostridiales bacterium]